MKIFEVEYEAGRFTFKVIVNASDTMNALKKFKKRWIKRSLKNGGEKYPPTCWVNGIWNFEKLVSIGDEIKRDFNQN